MKQCLFLFFLFFQFGNAEKTASYDIVIYGGTSAGVMAAVQAARMGKKVILVSPALHLGGLTSSGLGWTDLGKANTISGLSREFYQAIFNYYQDDSAWRQESRAAYISKMTNGQSWEKDMVPKNGIMATFEPHVAEIVFENFLKKENITVIKDRWLDREKGVEKSGTKILSIKMLSGEIYKADVFIDATYEGDLMAAAGVSFTVGRESNDTYDEGFNGIRVINAVKNQLPPVISPFNIKDNAASGLLPGINTEPGGADGSGDNKIQAYCYRMCLTDDPANRVEVQKPDNYNERDFEILLRAAEAGVNTFFKLDKMPNRKTDSNNSGGISTDYIGMNYTYPGATYAERTNIEKAHLYWQAGMIWTLQHHPRVPDSIKIRYRDWGLCKDEFAGSAHWPNQIYVREARRMLGDVVITEHYCLNDQWGNRPVAIGSYTMDSHNAQRIAAKNDNGKLYIKNEGDVQNQVKHPYGIDYCSMIPKTSEVSNLIVPVCLSASHIAYGSVRMEPVFMMLGQAAAAAASIAVDDKTNMEDVNYTTLRRRLLKDGMVMDVE